MSLIHFGCWGNYENIDYLRNILKEISQLPSPNIMTISGDNYYPKKENKQKILNREQFYDLQTLLDESTNSFPNRFILLGNHEFDSYVDEEECTSIDLHREFYSKSRINLVENCHSHIIDGHTLVIMINTSIYEIQDTCYKKMDILQTDKDGNPGNTEIQNQLDIVTHILDTNLKELEDLNNIIFVGHHPIISCRGEKPKKDKAKAKDKPNKYYLGPLHDFFRELTPFLADKNVYYLTSDTHCYQHIDIFPNLDKDYKIEQYIVGTGGASLDNCINDKSKCSKIILDEIGSFMEIKNTVSGENHFGYLSGNFNGKHWNLNFNLVKNMDYNQYQNQGAAAAAAPYNNSIVSEKSASGKKKSKRPKSKKKIKTRRKQQKQRRNTQKKKLRKIR